MSSAATLESHHDGGSGQDATGRGAGGPAPKRTVVAYGFWIFLLSDIIMFAGFFAAYAVLHRETAGGPDTHQLFDRSTVAIETVVLVFSTFTCALAARAAERQQRGATQIALILTGLLGAVFLALELREFAHMIARGAGPDRSAFLSAFFTLVGCHGLHVTAGLLWLGTMVAQLQAKGFRADIARRLTCLSLFWHTLDIIWVALFTIVYLLGTLP